MVRLALVGCTGVGKSSIILQLMGNTWEPTHFQTVLSESYIVNYNYQDETLRLEIEDTRGFDTTDRRQPLADTHGNSQQLHDPVRQAYIMVFDLCVRKTFDECQDIYPRVMEAFKANRIPPLVFLVGNKVDVDVKAQVNKDIAPQWATEHNIPYFEVSARRNQGVRPLIDNVITMIYRTYVPYSVTELKKFSQAQLPHRKMEGWVEKQGFFKLWFRFYAILCSRCLYFFKESDTPSPSSVIPLDSFEIVRDPSSTFSLLKLTVVDNVGSGKPKHVASYTLRFPSEHLLRQWEGKLIEIRQQNSTLGFFIHNTPAALGFGFSNLPNGLGKKSEGSTQIDTW
ncbi:hypothetical protein BLNAU_9182 [Blattamonas nauphoetae]|uniref:PH domain-containing protein n=1 Tax=Blattamonas nauphoetae TaxID=2049346 RepID=A0ABQ9XWI7_9EUKA|nr:hypothetical protein BLNAU_9182 [Blattamonas nauphoetae]